MSIKSFTPHKRSTARATALWSARDVASDGVSDMAREIAHNAAGRAGGGLGLHQERATYGGALRTKALALSDAALFRYLQLLEERIVTRLAAELAQLRQAKATVTDVADSNEDAIDQLLPPLAQPNAQAWQNEQNARLRSHFIEQCGGLLSSKQVADLLDSRAKNRAASANHLKDKGKAFCVRLHGQDYFPALQFDPVARRCYPEVFALIQALQRDVAPGWQLALWMIAENAWLDGRTPLAVWGEDRAAVIKAALAETAAFDA